MMKLKENYILTVVFIKPLLKFKPKMNCFIKNVSETKLRVKSAALLKNKKKKEQTKSIIKYMISAL